MRFAFGKNWISFSRKALSTERIDAARADFHRLLAPNDLKGRSFLDIGFGQGLALFLAAEAGARVIGLDIDPDNKAALEATSTYFPGIALPSFFIGSVLDDEFLRRKGWLEHFNIVHSWGVLHHTGEMGRALENACRLVRPGGLLVISIYNRHWSSEPWRWIKWLYNVLPALGQRLLIALLYPVILFAKFLVTRTNPYRKERGMDFAHDVVDWVGGFPYEYASPEDIRQILRRQGFQERYFRPAEVPTGCNEFVFQRMEAAAPGGS